MLKKRQDLAEWTRTKELQKKASFRMEDEERKSLEDSVHTHEQKRIERAKKQKQKIEEYHSTIRSEAQKIQELVKLGIDPSSLM